MNRKQMVATSNNAANPNKNVCAQAVAVALGVAGKVKYLHTLADLQRALRTTYSTRSRKSALVKGSGTVASVMRRLKSGEGDARYYVTVVEGHVLLLSGSGEVLRDTDGRKADRRKVKFIYGIFPKAGRKWADA